MLQEKISWTNVLHAISEFATVQITTTQVCSMCVVAIESRAGVAIRIAKLKNASFSERLPTAKNVGPPPIQKTIMPHRPRSGHSALPFAVLVWKRQQLTKHIQSQPQLCYVRGVPTSRVWSLKTLGKSISSEFKCIYVRFESHISTFGRFTQLDSVVPL